ncbi:MAG: hypothetical protein HY002_11370 [Candidatus Rokubacteria bacterium]|nr:hypothetical protein [Candidatus Rokubacteria bacterium]
MLILFFFVLVLGFITSLLPFIYPESVFNVLGASMNVLWGEFLVTTLNVGRGSLVDVADGTHVLNLAGVMAIYGTPLVFVLLVLRGRY